MKYLILIVFSAGILNAVCAQSFVHPGLLHSKEDLERMKNAVNAKEEPIYAGYQLFIENPASQNTYAMKGPLETVGRNPTIGQEIYDNDANAAHQNAIMWAITGNKAYAAKAIEIINAWSSTLQSITGRDAVLMAGLGPFKMVNAAEIVRYTNAGWLASDIARTEKHFKEIIYPVLKDFAPFANGNWDAAAIKTVMSIGVFCNDHAIFERGLQYYVNGAGNGRLTNYIINEEGQVQETGRDQGHTQLGIGLLSDCCEIAWHQGLNLYAYANNRLLKGFEYTAKYNLGNDVPFTYVLDRTGKYEHFKPSIIGRNQLRAVYEQVYNHYVNRMGLAAPYTKEAAEKLRPEGPGKPGADHPGYGTLYYTRKPYSGNAALLERPAPPGGLLAETHDKNILLSWIASVAAKNYSIKRSGKPGGPYTVIAKNISGTVYTDSNVKPGSLYYYTVSAINDKGESGNAVETTICAGLPGLWKQRDIGVVPLPGKTMYNGTQFMLEASGAGIDSLHDGAHFACIPLNGNGIISARFVPQPSSQFSTMGLMIREGFTDNAACITLVLYPGKAKSNEAPDWQLRFVTREKPGTAVTINNSSGALTAPTVGYGRLTGYHWLKLQRNGNTFTAYGSYDGNNWNALGAVVLPLKKNLSIGLVAASGMPNSTIVSFDNVRATGLK
jgi:hypothetical protein